MDDDPVADAGNTAAFARLHRDYVDATEQFAATNEILLALGRSGADPSAVLDTIVERAASLCRAQASLLYLIDGHMFRVSRISGDFPADLIEAMAAHPLAVTRTSLIGRVALDRRTQQIADVLSDPDYGRRDLQRIAGYRTLMSAPMLIGDEVVGVLSVWRTQVEPFEAREMELLGVFAAQAAIALRHVQLVGALESRSAELASKVDQLEALREVGEAVSSTLDLDEVLATIVANAVRLTGTDGGSIMEYVEADDSFSVRAAYGSSDAMIARLRGVRIGRESTLVGRAALDRRPLEVAELGASPLDPHLRILYDDGWRSVLAVPMLRQDRMVGALVIRRRTTGGFPEETLELLETFASQSALAILNARLFRELELKSTELEIVSRHKSEFLASMSHELRTPLNAVIGFSEVLLEKMFGDLNDRQEEYLRDIWGSGKHLLELLNEILDLSKVEAGAMELESSTFSVPQVIEYTLSLVRARAAAHSIALELTVDDRVDVIHADELRFKQVMLNLLTNAVKFTPDGGTVSVRAAMAGDELRVEVTDNGIGIPTADRERIFESFQQGRRGASQEEGTGLGLTLTRRIVELFGGRMWLDSEVGSGSTFGFAMPTGSTAGADATCPAPSGTTCVVLVDDDRASLDLLAAYLDGSGLEVTRTRDGREGLAAIRRIHPAVAILDIRLPGISGWDVLAELKADPVTARIPVVVVSIVDERARGLAMGAAEYLTKPVARDAVVAALARVGVLPAPVPADRTEVEA
ncbi:MAG TPA: GAF domain-containing protein [Nocardioidaceae bacterium]|nr:GAF domain-containing protein [Nocardioidaceae bacterium]